MIARKIIIGPVDEPIISFDTGQIKAVPEESQVSLPGAELAVDILEPLVEYNFEVEYDLVSSDGYKIVSSDGFIIKPFYNYDLTRIPRGTKVTYMVDNRISGEFYTKRVKRVARNVFQIPTVSAVGLMDSQPHNGDLYTGQSFDTVLADVLGPGYNYTVSEDAAAIQVFGLLPSSTRRKNLQKLCSASGVNILRSDSGGMLFTIIGNTTPELIPTENIYIDGDADSGEPASRVDVTEHAFFYLDSVEEQTLFDNTKSDAVVKASIKFKEPVNPETLRCSEGNLTIVESGVNYAIVTGLGVLVGKPYTHTTRIVSRSNPDAMVENVKSLPDNTLVTVANSDNVCLRLAEYYFNAAIIRNDIVLGTEKAGRRYSILNAFGERATGFLHKFSADTSGITKARCEFIQGYTPKATGSTYTHVEILDAASGIWTVPQEVKDKDIPNVRIVLIGGGSTGADGTKGAAGNPATVTQGTETVAASGKPGKGGAGGQPGKGGAGGKIYITTLNVAAVENLAFGRSGLNTWLKGGGLDISSALGVSSDTGFLEIFSGTLYALPGQDGQAGAKGGDGGLYKPPNGTSSNYASNGNGVTYNGRSFSGGTAGARNKGVFNAALDLYRGGGGGGGASAAANGNNGAPNGGGNGASGGTAAAAAAGYGNGGNGGHGGGGGGGAPVLAYYNWEYSHWVGADSGSRGSGGAAGKGSAGNPGCVLIYW